MNIDTLPDEADFVFFAETMPDEGLHRIAIAVDGMDAPIPTLLVTVTRDSALGIADRLNRRLGHDRAAWTAMAAASMKAEDGSGGGALH